jgi:hypothetical protein
MGTFLYHLTQCLALNEHLVSLTVRLPNIAIKSIDLMGMVALVCNPSIWEIEAG